jgi:DNA replication protein DnaC
MDHTKIIEMMKSLRLVGMPLVYDEIVSQGAKRRQSAAVVIEKLLEAEIAERKTRSIRYRMGQAKFPIHKDLDTFSFDNTPIDETQIHTLYRSEFVEEPRNVIFVGGTGTGKSHLAIALAANAVRNGYRTRFFNLVDLANQLEQEKLAGAGGKLSERLARYTELVVLDELGYLPFSKNGGQLVFHLLSKLYQRTATIITTNLAFRNG